MAKRRQSRKQRAASLRNLRKAHRARRKHHSRYLRVRKLSAKSRRRFQGYLYHSILRKAHLSRKQRAAARRNIKKAQKAWRKLHRRSRRKHRKGRRRHRRHHRKARRGHRKGRRRSKRRRRKARRAKRKRSKRRSKRRSRRGKGRWNKSTKAHYRQLVAGGWSKRDARIAARAFQKQHHKARAAKSHATRKYRRHKKAFAAGWGAIGRAAARAHKKRLAHPVRWNEHVAAHTPHMAL